MHYSRRVKYQIQLKRNDETSFTAIPTHLETFVRSRGYHRCRLVSCLRPPGFTPAGLPALDGTSVSPLKTRRVGGTVQWQQACWDAVCKHSVISFKFQIFRNISLTASSYFNFRNFQVHSSFLISCYTKSLAKNNIKMSIPFSYLTNMA